MVRQGSIILASSAIALGVFIAPVSSQIPNSEHRLWVLDLGSVPSYRQLRVQGTEVARAASVVFVDSNTVAVTYRVISARSSTDATDGISFFDASSGVFRDSLQWSGHDRFSADRNFIRLLPTRKGDFLVVVGRSIRHYSALHKETSVRTLALGDNSNWEWVVRVAPGGDTALLKRFGPGANEDHWISTETLEDRSVVAAPFYGYGYEVGQGFVVYTTQGGTTDRNQIRIHTSTGEDKILCPDCKGGAFGIVGDRIFFGRLPTGSAMIAKTDGTVLLRKTLSSVRAPLGQVSVARDSGDVAFYASFLKSGLAREFHAKSTIVVLNALTLQERRRFDFDEPGEEGDGNSQKFLSPILAISPDGAKLALLWRTELADRYDRLEVFPLHN